MRPCECLGSVWSQRDRPGAAGVAPTVRATVTQFNTVTGCVLGSVLGPPGLAAPQRAQRLEKWIHIAQVRVEGEAGRAEGRGPRSGNKRRVGAGKCLRESLAAGGGWPGPGTAEGRWAGAGIRGWDGAGAGEGIRLEEGPKPWGGGGGPRKRLGRGAAGASGQRGREKWGAQERVGAWRRGRGGGGRLIPGVRLGFSEEGSGSRRDAVGTTRAQGEVRGRDASSQGQR